VKVLGGSALELAQAGTQCVHPLHCPFPSPPVGPSSSGKEAQIPRMTYENELAE